MNRFSSATQIYSAAHKPALICRVSFFRVPVALVAAVLMGAATHIFPVITIAQQAPVQELFITEVTVVDTHSGKLTPTQTVQIRDGKIVKIGPSRKMKTGAGVKVVDGSGKFIVPGYWNMHAHVFEGSDTVPNLNLMLANGITGFRQMGGTDQQLEQRKDGTLMPATDGPELLATPGGILTRVNAPTHQKQRSPR